MFIGKEFCSLEDFLKLYLVWGKEHRPGVEWQPCPFTLVCDHENNFSVPICLIMS